MNRLAGKVAVITGAASGIGRATAALFLAEGARVFASDLTAPDIEGATNIAGDAASEEEVTALVERAVADAGGLDIAFANAGVSGGLASLFEQSPADWTEILRVNLIGPFLMVKHAAEPIRARGGGSIICTASVAGLRSGAGGPAYTASKHGVIGLVKVAAEQLTGSNVRVNAVCPGLIETGMTAMIYDHARSRGAADRLGALNPLRRGGEPDEIARAALFLASDESSYVNGHALVVDGGLSASHPFTRQEYGRTAT